MGKLWTIGYALFVLGGCLLLAAVVQAQVSVTVPATGKEDC